MAFLGSGETQIELICYGGEQTETRIDRISLGFDGGNLEQKIKFIEEKGLVIDSGPFSPAPNVRFFFVRDPNGVKIQFVGKGQQFLAELDLIDRKFLNMYTGDKDSKKR